MATTQEYRAGELTRHAQPQWSEVERPILKFVADGAEPRQALSRFEPVLTSS